MNDLEFILGLGVCSWLPNTFPPSHVTAGWVQNEIVLFKIGRLWSANERGGRGGEGGISDQMWSGTLSRARFSRGSRYITDNIVEYFNRIYDFHSKYNWELQSTVTNLNGFLVLVERGCAEECIPGTLLSRLWVGKCGSVTILHLQNNWEFSSYCKYAKLILCKSILNQPFPYRQATQFLIEILSNFSMGHSLFDSYC